MGLERTLALSMAPGCPFQPERHQPSDTFRNPFHQHERRNSCAQALASQSTPGKSPACVHLHAGEEQPPLKACRQVHFLIYSRPPLWGWERTLGLRMVGRRSTTDTPQPL